ncbi:MAG TPA: fused MFS/spermidine synthase, partial [Pirellulaceae bacterium]|nr:fused MFS/spermidine synthase [Pirellulaceae bacterium]
MNVGTIAAYGAPGERWTFFELDAAIERTARGWFTYLADSKAAVDVRIGDGRLLLAASGDAEFGLILLDAFNSDAIPMHLLTREALAIYLRKLAPGGVIAVHVSSRYVDLPPLVGDLAADAGLVARWRNETGLPDQELDRLKRESTWVVVARRSEDFGGLPWAD